jgi:U3 small nucleolar RNA-associated protein MPP10
MEVAADLPAISMEEALPVGMSTADALAPEERHAPKRGRAGEFLEPTEMEQDDRKRARLAKKRSRNKSRKRDEAEHKLVSRANPGLGNPYEKRKMLEDIRSSRNVVEGKEVDTGKEFNTSGKFFREMEKTVREGVKKSRVGSQEHEGRKRGGGGAAALKL